MVCKKLSFFWMVGGSIHRNAHSGRLSDTAKAFPMNSSGCPFPWQNHREGQFLGATVGKMSSRKEEFCRTKEQPTMIFPFGGNPFVVQHANEAKAFMDVLSTGQNSVEATAEMSG